MQALIARAVKDGHRGLGHVYDQLCDVAHFGRGAVGLPLRAYEEEGQPAVRLSIRPHWASELHELNALAMIEEQTLAIAWLLCRYHEVHVAPLLADPARARAEGQVLGTARPRPRPASDDGTPSPPRG